MCKDFSLVNLPVLWNYAKHVTPGTPSKRRILQFDTQALTRPRMAQCVEIQTIKVWESVRYAEHWIISDSSPSKSYSIYDMPISHVMIKAEASKHTAVVDFYTQALQPLGYEKLKSFPNGITGFGNQSPDLWVAIDAQNSHSTIHFAFQAPSKPVSTCQGRFQVFFSSDPVRQTPPRWMLSFPRP